MSTYLADGNLLIALAVSDHIHHGAANEWFETEEPTLATCPITEGTLLRFLMREGLTAVVSIGVLDVMRTEDWHEFWPDSICYDASHLAGVLGHRQITDAYLVALARRNESRVATFDRGLAALHGDGAMLLTS